MGTDIGGKDGQERTYEEVTKLRLTIEKNNELTSEQNNKMVKYTTWITRCTFAILGLAIVQAGLVIVQILLRR